MTCCRDYRDSLKERLGIEQNIRGLFQLFSILCVVFQSGDACYRRHRKLYCSSRARDDRNSQALITRAFAADSARFSTIAAHREYKSPACIPSAAPLKLAAAYE